MHAAMQPPEKGGTELPPRGVRPHQGAAAPLVGPPGHRLRVVGSSLGPDPSRGYGWIQFGVLVGFSIYL
jgi:hypothetical protein